MDVFWHCKTELNQFKKLRPKARPDAGNWPGCCWPQQGGLKPRERVEGPMVPSECPGSRLRWRQGGRGVDVGLVQGGERNEKIKSEGKRLSLL